MNVNVNISSVNVNITAFLEYFFALSGYYPDKP